MPFSNRPREGESSASPRKLFRATLDFKRSPNKRREMRQAPPENTNAENFYYLKQMNAKTPMVIVMNDGETVRGWIEWYDRGCLKLNREGAPNLLINKTFVKYLYKQEEEV